VKGKKCSEKIKFFSMFRLFPYLSYWGWIDMSSRVLQSGMTHFIWNGFQKWLYNCWLIIQLLFFLIILQVGFILV